MDLGFTTAVYVVAAILFILSLGGLSGQESAKRAVWYGIFGMGLAVLATVIGPGAGLWQLTAVLVAIGGLIGYQLASKVEMTQMPELVAGMHALVGLAAVFVGFNAHFELANVMTMDDMAKKALEGFAALLAKKSGAE
ncbi:MAG: NAD(P) transhydrogenase subunit beta, partial [Alphaproteobacteria bacterium]|nr:NAD(P) transhydrogenase subunit beta [Alphaproteobacteria bacterium]